MSARQAEQARQDVERQATPAAIERQATPAAEDVCPMCEYWRCRCGESVSGGSR
ncbi:hypothetical protein [Streptomyces graminilatus]|uniref:hypothetical protein n=1 Tax=Streptomyces graminilatus TaxID=1464070 RepID=UPI0012FEFCA7|nr:hypothetical protein [Streptomyces graminilatus]